MLIDCGEADLSERQPTNRGISKILTYDTPTNGCIYHNQKKWWL